jgi:hypothetical protein
LAGSVLYQREIRTDRLALYTERLAFDFGLLLGNVSIDAKGKYDMAYADFNDAKLTITTPIAAGFDFSVQGRRYLPFFELWTIWGAFSPVAFNEATGALRWSSPRIGLSLEAAGGYRKYEDTNAGAQLGQPRLVRGRRLSGDHRVRSRQVRRRPHLRQDVRPPHLRRPERHLHAELR